MALLPRSLLADPGLIAAAALAVLVLWYLVPAVCSPLRHVPGPAVSRATSAVLRWHELHGRRTRYVHALHRQYGPVVRLGPREVSFASAAGVKDIYNTAGSGFDKTAFYDLFTVYGRRTMFTMRERDKHARRRRILADRYANSSVMRAPALAGIEERSRRFVDCVRQAPAAVLDIYMALHAYAFDCVTHHLFHPYGTDSLRQESDMAIMREITFDDSLQNRLIRFYSPTLYALAGRLVALFARPRTTPLANRFVLDASAKTDTALFTVVARMHETLQKEEKRAADADAAAQTAQPAQPPQPPGFDALDAAAECLDHMAAGIDTTGDALCFLMWELSLPRSRPYQARLQRELRDHAAQAAAAASGLDRLPFLDAVVLEGLRCFPAIPMSLPRVVPGRDGVRSRGGGGGGQDGQGHDTSGGGRVVDGVFLPAGTVVSSQAYSVHRLDPAVFPDPDAFRPDRWLAPDGDADRKRLFFAFASGGRGCIGKHLALAEMKILLRDVYARYTTLPDPSMTPASMAMSDQLISSRPLGQRCLLRFVPLGDAV